MKFYRVVEQKNLGGIERVLQDNLIPIQPRPGFVKDLRYKLAGIKPERPVLPRGWRTFIVSTAGVFSGLLIVGAAVRAIAGLVGMLNLVRQVRPPKSERAPSPTPA